MDAAVLMSDAFWGDGRSVAMAAEGVVPPDLTDISGCVFFQTSGSIEAPKWMGLSKRGLLVSAAAVNAHLRVTEDSCWGLLLPLHHVGGFGVVARAHQAGCRLAVHGGRWAAQEAVSWLERERVTHMSVVPTQVVDLVKAGLRAPGCLVAVVVGGGHLSADAGQAARELGWPVLASYGMTEAGSQIATQGLDALGEAYRPAPIPLLPHWRVEVDAGGLLGIAGESLFEGTLEKAGDSWVFRKRQGGWYRTKDRVTLGEEGLTPRGRADLQVKVLGELVDLERVEQDVVALAEGGVPHGSLIIVALPDERAGHRLVPVCDGRLERDVVIAALQRYHQRAPGYARLAQPEFLDPFPRSSLGKPLRGECARLVGDRIS